MEKKIKEFLPTSWSIDNKTSIFVLTVIITLTGIISYINLPKEKVPGYRNTNDLCQYHLSWYFSKRHGKPDLKTS